MRKLTEKQIHFIDENYPTLSSREIARRLKVEKAEVDRYIAARALTGKKRIVFMFAAMALPVLVLAGIEFCLHLGHYGSNLDLVVTKQKGEQKYYALNPQVGKRYFSRGIFAVPEIYEEHFAYEKSKNGYRIFCLGGSTTASFPYELNARFHRLLQDRLTTLFPDRTIEVINVGMSAVNSYTVLDFIKELVCYDPDLFLLYMGHNEFYGAFGVGSTQYLGKNRGLVKLYLGLQRFKTFRLLRDGIAVAKGMFSSSNRVVSDQTLMELMVRDKYIALGSEDYRRAAEHFKVNLTEIIQVAKRNQIGILVSTLVSNLRDQEPFHSLFSPAITPEDREKWEGLFRRGIELENQGTFEAALDVYHQAQQIDDMPAKLHFQMGKCYEHLGKYADALASFQRARDRDALRFRASSEFNDIIRQVCREQKVPVVDMERAFAERSRHGIVGNELISEHLHPNFDGYLLMAKTFCQAMAENHFVASSKDWNRRRGKSDEEYKRLSGVTELDLEIGALKIEQLTSRWPFRSLIRMGIPSGSDPAAGMIRSVAENYARGDLSWNDAHYQLADYYRSQGQYDRAFREYLAVLKILPENYYPYFKIGDLYLTQRRYSEAHGWFSKAARFNPRSPFVFAKLGTVCMFQKAYDKAITSFRTALALNAASNQFSSEEAATVQYYKAVSHLQLNQKNQAMQALVEAVQLQPANAQAQQLLALLRANANVQLQLTQ